MHTRLTKPATMTDGRVAWLSELDAPDAFPPVGQALREPDGLLAAGGDLCTPRLLAAYRRGIFPWYDEGQPVLWWSPDPRCVFGPGDLHLSRRFLQEARNSTLTIRINVAFADVIRRCAEPRRHQQGTWITNDMRDAYRRLHNEGWAHSIEVWDANELTGGLYGLCIGRAFFGESMFSAKSNASKYALLFMESLLRVGTIGVLDCQVQSSHLLAMGAKALPRAAFITLLDELCSPAVAIENWPADPIPVTSLLPG